MSSIDKKTYQVSEIKSASYISMHTKLDHAKRAARKAYRASSKQDTFIVLHYTPNPNRQSDCAEVYRVGPSTEC